MLSTWKVAPALAAGNTVILKPAEWSPLSCSLLADLTVEAGFPPGVFNLVQGIGEEVGPPLVGDPRVKRISFTGSPETARHIGRAAAENIVPFTAELGGKGPLIVFADADLDAAAAQGRRAVRRLRARSASPAPGCSSRRRCATSSSPASTPAVDRHVLGDSRDPATTIAPMIHPDHVDRVLGFVERARAARRHDRARRAPGRRHAARRADADRAGVERQRGRAARGVRTGADAADVRRRGARRSSWPTRRRTGCRRSSTRRRRSGPSGSGGPSAAGIVWVNTFLVRDLTAPFGGIGISGIGREGGDYALDFHSDLKTLQIAEGIHVLTISARRRRSVERSTASLAACSHSSDGGQLIVVETVVDRRDVLAAEGSTAPPSAPADPRRAARGARR